MNKITNKVIFTLTSSSRAVTIDKINDAFSELASEKGLNINTLVEDAHKIKNEWFPFGAVIDIERFSNILKSGYEDLEFYASICRIKLQGTDGIRGKINKNDFTKREALGLFLTKGQLSPAFFNLNAEAFGLYLLDKKAINLGDSVIIGEDGRDALTNGKVVSGVVSGLNSSGCKVLNSGIIPTPGVPYGAFYNGCTAGVIITASHNPSNQNGIKLIYNNFKLMDDGEIGEFGLTKYIYQLAEENKPFKGDLSSVDISEKNNLLLKKLILENIDFSNIEDNKIVLVYDGANGAFSKIAPQVLGTLPFDVKCLNVDSKGHNINQDGGVGELEGTEKFIGNVDSLTFDNYFPIIKEIFKSGRLSQNKKVFGIVNDGDGDRGYLLVYDKDLDVVHVVPGDELATLILAKKDSEGLLTPESILVNSVESDIMAAGSAKTRFGIKNVTACVGDKWLLVPAKDGLPFAVGCEESGHVTFGISFNDLNDKQGIVYTGNGLLSVLNVLEYVLKNNLSIEEIIHPFSPGYKSIRYVYFVDKNRFLPGSPAFIEAEKIANKSLKEQLGPKGYKIETIFFKDAPEMIYISVKNREDQNVGALFIRNSGTESKTGVAIRCQTELQESFIHTMNLVNLSNRKYLKNMDMLEAVQESNLLEKLKSGSCHEKDLLKHEPTLDQNNLDALLYAMRKQKLIKVVSEGQWQIMND